MLGKMMLGTAPYAKAVQFSIFSFQMCKAQELHIGAGVELDRQRANFKNRKYGGIYIIGNARSLRLKKNCIPVHSCSGLQKQALRRLDIIQMLGYPFA